MTVGFGEGGGVIGIGLGPGVNVGLGFGGGVAKPSEGLAEHPSNAIAEMIATILMAKVIS